MRSTEVRLISIIVMKTIVLTFVVRFEIKLLVEPTKAFNSLLVKRTHTAAVLRTLRAVVKNLMKVPGMIATPLTGNDCCMLELKDKAAKAITKDIDNKTGMIVT